MLIIEVPDMRIADVASPSETLSTFLVSKRKSVAEHDINLYIMVTIGKN